MLLLPLVTSLAAAGASPEPGRGDLDFARDVRPLLARRCFPCHGNDEETREAGLRLDLEGEAHRDRDGFAAVVPGDLEASELWARVNDDLDPMPPEDAGAPLDEEERELLRRWIEGGGGYTPHWSFAPPVRPAIPGDPHAGEHPVDAFVREALEAHGLELSPPADDRQLIRRLSLDLTGLAPTPQFADEFAASEDPGKLERAVDALLDSPAYAERWAAVWLDLARYADSTGHGSDPLRTIWRYRDWVIDAYDRNLPFDEFTVQQLAGDLLPDASMDTRLATAFHRNTMTNTEGGTDDEEFRVLAVKDRVNTTMEVWMGVTAGCAECHSHKYDPVSHEEYYELFDIFNQTADTDRGDDRPRLATPTPEQAGEKARLDAELARVDHEIATAEVDVDAGVARMLEAERFWAVTEQRRVEQVPGEGTRVDVFEAEAVLPVGSTEGGAPLGLRLSALASPSLPGGGPGESPGNGNFVVTDLRVARGTAGPAPVAAAVRIELPGPGRILSLAEVEVLDADGRNLALGGRAAQSSTGFNGPPQLAVDGNTSGVYEDGSVTHTATERDPWWEVTLAAPAPIHGLRVWSRTDGDLELRLEGFEVVLLDGTGEPVLRTAPWPAPNPVAEARFGEGGAIPLLVRPGSASFEQANFGVAAALDLDPKTGWAIGPRQGVDHAAIFQLPAQRSDPDGGLRLRVTVAQEWGSNHTIRNLRLGVGRGARVPLAIPADVRGPLARRARVASVGPGAAEPGDEAKLVSFLRERDPLLGEVHQRRAQLAKQLSDLDVVTTPVMEELPADRRRETHVMVRGNFLQRGEQVHAAIPAAFGALDPDAPVDRLAFARWLVSDDNPLTARVTVNRLWARLFGRGLVATEGDFGSQGATPTHPELLDWLAVEFREGGWDQKALLKTIVTSRAYRQASAVRPETMEADPDGVWLSRYPRQRLEAEMVRDVTLQAAGLLSDKRYGPSVYPPQPEGLWQAAFNGQRNWRESMGEDRYRRGVYVFMRRTIPYPMLATFDAPSREACTVCRTPTNTPLQAFVTLNDPAFLEPARVLGARYAHRATTGARWSLEPDRVVGEGPEALSRALLEELLSQALQRPAGSEQLDVLQALLGDARAAFAADPEAAGEFAGAAGAWSTGLDPEEAEALTTVDPVDVAAWTVAASTVLNMDSFLTKE